MHDSEYYKADPNAKTVRMDHEGNVLPDVADVQNATAAQIIVDHPRDNEDEHSAQTVVHGMDRKVVLRDKEGYFAEMSLKRKEDATAITRELNDKGYTRVEKGSYSLTVGVSGEQSKFNRDKVKEPELTVNMPAGTAFKLDRDEMHKGTLHNVGKQRLEIVDEKGQKKFDVHPNGEATVVSGSIFRVSGSKVEFRLETERQEGFPQLYLGIKE